MTADDPLRAGTYVVLDGHAEFGIGRIIAAGAFASRVLFTRAGLRVIRSGDLRGLSVAMPSGADVALLVELEATFVRDVLDPTLWPSAANDDDVIH